MLGSNTFAGGTGKFTGNRRSRSRLLTAAAMAALGTSGMLVQRADAANDKWVGNTSTSFSGPNWNTSGPVNGDTLEFGVAGSAGTNLTDNLLTPGSYNISGFTFDSGASAFVINPATAAVNGFVLTGPITDNATSIETLNDSFALGSNQTVNVASGSTLNLGGNISGAFGITQTGGGTLNLSGANIYTGATTVSNGTLNVSGNIASTASTLTVGNVLNTNAVMNINSGSNIAALNLLVGTTAAGSGAVYQNGGLVALSQGAGTTNFALGNVTGGYGYYKLAGGVLTTNEMGIGGATGSTTGVMDVTGGTVNDAGWITIQRGAGGAGVLNINGGTVLAGTQAITLVSSVLTDVSGAKIGLLWGGGSAQLSVTNGSIIGPNNNNGAAGYVLDLSASNVAGTSVVNINSGGLIQVTGVISTGTTATEFLNFNGGTLKYTGQNTQGNGNFLAGSGTPNAGNVGVYIYGGGATFDSNGGAITVTHPLLAPTADGVSSTTVTGSGLTGLTTTGYIGAPVVTITGGAGKGATGVATINSSGVLTGITITNAGTGYSPTDSLTVSLSGGGVAGSTGTVPLTLTPNVSTGGLTLNGGGQITLGDTAITPDTYTGATTLNGGKLTLDFTQSNSASGIISSSSPLVLNGGNLTLIGKASTTNSQIFNGTSLTGGGALITMTPNATANPLVLNLGAITRTAPATTNITLSGTSSATNGVVTSTANNTAGITGGWATIGGADWATNSGGNLVALPAASYTALALTGGVSTANYQTATATNTLTGSVVANSVKLTTGVTGLVLGANNLTLNGSSGGLLIAGTAAPTISGTGILSAGAGNELILQDWSSGATTISAPIMATNDTGRLTKAGSGNLTISSANSYTGGTMIAGGTVTVSSNTALGTGPIELNPDGVVGVGTGVGLNISTGVTIPNNILVDRSTGSSGAGAIYATGAAGGEIDGNITIAGPASPGGHFNGPGTTGVYLTIKGNLFDTAPVDNSGLLASGVAYTGINAIVIRSGNIKLYNPGGLSSYPRIDERTGTLQIGGTNGVATNAVVDIGINGSATFDLNGFNQSIVALSQTNNQGNTRLVTNSSATSASTLTLTPLAAGLINSNLSSTDVLTDTSASFPLNLTINGDPTGTQTLGSTTSSYRGVTTLLNSTLSIPALANGGSNSSIGASTNAVGNLVFGGGTLLYTGATTSTDRSFTVNSGTTANFNISNSAAVVTFSSAGGTTTTTGSFNKLGAGTLVFSGAQGYTGPTTISTGTFQLTSTGSLAGGVVVPTGSTFIAGGSAAGTTLVGAGATIVPGATSFVNATLPTLPTVTLNSTGVYTTGGLTLQKNSVVDFAFGTGINGMFNLSSGAPLTVYGGVVDITNSGAATAFSTAGTYTLINYTAGQFSGSVNNFSIVDAQAGKSYAFANTGTAITLTIANSTTGNWSNGTGDELWTDNGNWLNSSIPNGVSATANFGSNLANTDGNVNLASTNETVGFLNLDNTNTPSNVSFNISSSGTGVLILDNGTSALPVVTVTAGNHVITSPVQLNSPLSGATTITTGTGSSLTLGGTISNGSNGAQAVNFAGSGTVFLTTASNAIATSNVSGGTLEVGNGGVVGTLGTGTVNLSAGTTLAFNRSDSSNIVTANIGGATGTVTQIGTGITTLTPSSANTFGTTAGGLVVVSGGIKLGNASAVPSGVLVTMTGGTLDLNTFNTSVGSLTGGTSSLAGGVITDTAAVAGTTTLTDTLTAAQSYYGTINNGINGRILAFVKSGSGELSLSGSSTYSGGTSLTAGALDVLNNNALGTNTVTLSAGATQLKIGNGVTLPNKIIVNAGAGGVGLGTLTTVNLTDTATFAGEIDVNAIPGSGGVIGQPIGGTSSGLLSFTGPIIAGGTATSIVVRSGNVQLADTTGNSSYPLLIVDTTGLSLGHNNGIATNTVLQMSNAGNPGNGTIDLNGYNQTVAGITFVGQNVGVITNTQTAPNTNPSPTGPFGTSVLTVNTSATAFPDTAPDTYGGLINSYVQLVKTGAGTLSLTNTTNTGVGANNTYFGGTIIQQGVLAVALLDGSSSGASNLGVSYAGAADLVFAAPGGTLRYTGATSSTSRAFTINDGVTATMDVSTAASTLTVTGSATVDGTEGTNSSTYASFAKGPGAGTLVLAGTYPYHGDTTVNGGTLLVTGNTGTSGSGNLVVASGATLGGTGTVNGTLNHTAGTIVGGASATVPTTGSLTFTGPVTLNGGIDLNNVNASLLVSSPTVNQQGFINASGGLSFGTTPETVNLQVTNTLPVGSYVYNLFTYTGTLGGTPNLVYLSNLGRSTFTTDLTTAGEVNVDIVNSMAAGLYWNSTTSGVWDIHTNTVPTSGTGNWYNSATNLATDKFYQGDNVTFADSGTAVGTGTLGSPLQTTITLASGVIVQPGSVTDTANTTNYNISGAGSIGGPGALTTSGASTLTLSTSNVYTGGTNINGGLLALNNAAAIGTTGTISFGGGTLQYSAVNTTDYSARFSTAAGQAVNVDTNGQNVTFASALTSSGGTLTKLGAGTLTLGATNTYTGDTTITAGTLAISSQANLNGNGRIVFNGGSLGGSGTTLSNALVVNAAGGSLTATGNAFFTGMLIGSGTLVSNATAADVFTGAGFTAGNSSSAASFTGTMVSQFQVNITDISASPYAAYNASVPSPTNSANNFVYGVTTAPAGPIQLGSLTGVAGSNVRNGNSAGIGPVTWQIGSLNTSTVFAGNLINSFGGAAANTSSLNKVGTGSLTMSGTNTYTGGTTVTNGSLILASTTAFPANGTIGTSLTVASNAQVTVANHLTSLTPSTTPFVPEASTLTNNGTIDLVNNDFIIHNGTLSTTFGQIATGFHGGLWNGTSTTAGVITSSLAASDSTYLTAVGVATGLTSTNFENEGITVVASDVIVKYTYYGDANLDGAVDGSDYTLIDAGFNSHLTGWQNGDFNYDGVVDGSDYTLIDNAFNTQGASLGTNPASLIASTSAQIAGGTSAVPEPTTLGLLGIGAIGLLGRRRR